MKKKKSNQDPDTIIRKRKNHLRKRCHRGGAQLPYQKIFSEKKKRVFKRENSQVKNNNLHEREGTETKKKKVSQEGGRGRSRANSQ